MELDCEKKKDEDAIWGNFSLMTVDLCLNEASTEMINHLISLSPSEQCFRGESMATPLTMIGGKSRRWANQNAQSMKRFENNQSLSIHHQINALTQGTVVFLGIGAFHITSFDTANHFDSEFCHHLHLKNRFNNWKRNDSVIETLSIDLLNRNWLKRGRSTILKQSDWVIECDSIK
jgi:hypothetical protein